MSKKLNCLLLLVTLLFSFGSWADVTKDITIPAWSMDSIYGDNTVYEMNLIQSSIEVYEDGGSLDRGGVFLEAFSQTPSIGDKRCLDDDCNYYLDVSEISVSTFQRQNYQTFNGLWGNGGYKGMPSGGGGYYNPSSRGIRINSSSKIKIKKRNTGAVILPPKAKTITISASQCDPGKSWYYSSTCNGLNHQLYGIRLHLNINVPAPTLPKVQCYMSPWSGSIDFQPVTVPVESSKAGQANWPLGGGFTGVEQQSAYLDVTCNNIDEGMQSFPLQVKLSGTNWTYGSAGELYFGNEKSIAVAASLRMNSIGNGVLALDGSNNASCHTYWKSAGANAFEMSAAYLGSYLNENHPACLFTHTLPTPHNIVEGFRFTLDAILGVTTQRLTAIAPTYGKHTGALMLEINSL